MGHHTSADAAMSTLFGMAAADASAARRAERAMAALADLHTRKHVRFGAGGGELFALEHSLDDRGCAFRSGSWHCVVDARVDNVAELRKRLAGSAFEVPADCRPAQLILALFQMLGNRVWDCLRGDFACAVWQPHEGRLVLARDVIGSRPMYWANCADSVFFSSELRALMALCGRTMSTDLEQAQRMLYRGGSSSPEPGRTFIEGVFRVPPGTYCEWRGGQLRQTRYWDPRKLSPLGGLSYEQAATGLRERIQTAVLKRTAVHGEIGCHFSGGLDCSSIAAILWTERERTAKSPTLYSWTPRAAVPQDADELQRIDELVATHGLDVCYLDPDRFASSRAEHVQLSADPLYPWDTLEFERHVLSAARAKGLRHLMSGWGGDEAASHQGLGLAPELLLNGHWRQLVEHLSATAAGESPLRLRAILGRVRRELWGPLRACLRRPAANTLAAPALRRQYDFRPTRATELGTGLNVLETQLWRYFDGYLTDRVESWYCHGKLQGVTYSYPLLDRDVLEFVYRLPGRHFFRDRQPRAVFRSAMQSYWPEGAAAMVAKTEPGLQGFLRASGTAGNANWGASLRAEWNSENVQRLIDSSLLSALQTRLDAKPTMADLDLLSRAEWITRQAWRLHQLGPG